MNHKYCAVTQRRLALSSSTVFRQELSQKVERAYTADGIKFFQRLLHHKARVMGVQIYL